MPPRPDPLQAPWPQRVVAAVHSRTRGGRRWRSVRRLTAAALIVLAGALAMAPPPADGRSPGLVLLRDLPLGTTLTEADVRLAAVADPPDGVLVDPATAVGQVLGSAARRGEVLTDRRLTSALWDPGDGRVAVPVRPADAGAIALLAPGSVVAVVAVDEAGAARTLTDRAVVLALPAPAQGQQPLVVLAVPLDQADAVAAAGLTDALAFRSAR
ncbi:SAF domain-containing protein [Nakamurella flavida]|uniref:SAF domain-containing protein n=1 Tax=Nakamurella flavida TaxID=363630 RepID=A0A938YNR1_9ACTN|nr:SAF domain-containing protein [Nakamurella flavida]MBM9476215.1 SAF domain-containing protein [Nakamurella flavida]MDP9779687.1 hypothetical protein [Nakamurella flavida]